MRRRVVQLVLLLVAGAIVNVAVAWGCAEFANFRAGHSTIQEYEIKHNVIWMVVQENSAGAARLSSIILFSGSHIPNPPPSLKQVSPKFPWWCRYHREQPTNSRHWQQFVAGWPMYSHWAGFPPRGTSRFGELVHEGGIEVGDGPHFNSSDLGNAKIVPLRPLWLGFVINTIFYAAIMWVAFFVPGKLKRTLRRRRGQCPACAYPVGTSNVCTECGNPLGKGR